MVLVVTACGDDDDDDGGAANEATAAGAAETTTAAATGSSGGSDGAAAGDDAVVVGLVDYEFVDLPASVPAGTRLTVENRSEAELHELVALRLPDDEERSVEELLALPEEEQDAVLGTAEPAMVLLAPPGSSEVIPAVGDGTLTEPGRYLVACAIPTGADPEAYLDAPPSDGPPAVDGGPPHFMNGMFGEIVVE
jgi:hypothetical protein